MANKKIGWLGRQIDRRALCALVVTGFLIVPFGAQEPPGKKEDVLQLSIQSESEYCLGSKISISVRLRNVSARPVVINTGYLWRYGSEKALDRHSSSLIKIPEMRAHAGDSFDDPDDFVSLGPGEQYTSARIIDTKADSFYRSPGRYAIRLGYGQFQKRSKFRKALFVGSVWADERVFLLKDCAEDVEGAVSRR